MVHLAVHPVSEFRRRCYAFVRSVPVGRVTTYADVARAAGVHRAARAVGTAMAFNDESWPGGTPCHRVVRADGTLGGYLGGNGGARRKAELLRSEGIRVSRGGRIQDFARVRWPPG